MNYIADGVTAELVTAILVQAILISTVFKKMSNRNTVRVNNCSNIRRNININSCSDPINWSHFFFFYNWHKKLSSSFPEQLLLKIIFIAHVTEMWKRQQATSSGWLLPHRHLPFNGLWRNWGMVKQATLQRIIKEVSKRHESCLPAHRALPCRHMADDAWQ